LLFAHSIVFLAPY